MWYRLANQFGEPTPFVPEAPRKMGPNEVESIAPAPAMDAHTMPAWSKRRKELANPQDDPYNKTLEGQLTSLHHETKNQIDPNAQQAEALWRGLDIKKQSDAAIPQDKNWPSHLSRVQV